MDRPRRSHREDRAEGPNNPAPDHGEPRAGGGKRRGVTVTPASRAPAQERNTGPTRENAWIASGPAPDNWSRSPARRGRRAAPAFFRKPAGRRSGRAPG